jgi:hypothetical protein
MRKWRSQSHVRWYCRYHVVWVPKALGIGHEHAHHPVLPGVDEQLTVSALADFQIGRRRRLTSPNTNLPRRTSPHDPPAAE